MVMAHALRPIKLAVLAFLLTFFTINWVWAELVDKIIASVDDTAITHRELENTREEFLSSGIRISPERTLDIMIDRLLMLREAKKLRFEGDTEDKLILEYVNLKIKAFISVRKVTIRNYYDSHKDDFRGISFEDARKDIRSMLVNRITNTRLRQHLDNLKKESDIKIYLQNNN
jgi:hypothetical protein